MSTKYGWDGEGKRYFTNKQNALTNIQRIDQQVRHNFSLICFISELLRAECTSLY